MCVQVPGGCGDLTTMLKSNTIVTAGMKQQTVARI